MDPFEAIAQTDVQKIPDVKDFHPDRADEPKSVNDIVQLMLGDVWEWAGTFRTTERNIGIQAYRVGVELAGLLRDVRYWIEHKTFPPDEIAIRFHHRLVAIHPFPNGNGRHARLAADLLIERLGGERFSWGGRTLADVGELRTCYVAVLRAADNHDIAPLLEFART
ncbi:Fic-DOC domain mobile mystery protein B [Rhizobium tibeticum]|nr:Fic-DOC domain mobile mystery protein B [Rhizobium tibeticum]